MAANIHTGFAIDFLRLEDVYSEQAIFSVPGAHELIVTPGIVKEGKMSDSSLRLEVMTELYTTKNTLGPGAVVFNHAFPNISAIRVGEDTAGNPIVTNDGITRTFKDVDTALMETEMGEEATTIFNQLGLNKRPRLNILGDHSDMRGLNNDEFVGMIRPPSLPSMKNLPVMGINKAHALHLEGSTSTPWTNFIPVNHQL